MKYIIYFVSCHCSTLQMLVNIENRLEELFEQIEMMPQDKVEAAEKVSETSRSCFSIKLIWKISFEKRCKSSVI